MIQFKQDIASSAEKKPLSLAQRRKRDNRRRSLVRVGIQIVFFLFAPSLFTSAFTGLKQAFTAIGGGAPLEFSGFACVFVMLCLFTVVFGRFFCGFACSFGALGDFVYFLRTKVEKKTKKKLPRLPKKLAGGLACLPFLILTAVVVLCAVGIYGSLSGWSPWDVFSMLTTLNLRLGCYLVGVGLLAGIVVGMALEPRFFCRFFCPLGAVFRLLPMLPWSVLKRDTDACIKGCSACTASCPVSHRLGTEENAGNCIRCDKCIGVCPKQNIKTVGRKQPAVALLLTVGKAAILFLLAFLLHAVRFF